MLIKIAERLKPYSHRPGTRFLLPGSTIVVTVFPALLRVGDAEDPLEIVGPVEGFTAQLDLEHGYLKVWGHAASGYFRYRLQATPVGGVSLVWEKGALSAGSEAEAIYVPTDSERLSLGSHKAQDWNRIVERLELSEIFPFWFRMGRLLPMQPVVQGTGTTKLLVDCAEVMAAKDTLKIPVTFRTLLRAGFEGVLVPRLLDSDHQGLNLPTLDPAEESLALLSEGARLIRSLFIQMSGHEVHLLPLLPPELHCGRMLNLACGQSSIDMEWSKKTIRRVLFRCRETAQWRLHLQKDLREFRVRCGNKDRGRVISRGTSLDLLAGRDYFFDNFRR